VGSVGGLGLLGSGGFAFFQFFGELLGDAFRWDAESFGGDWLPDWLGELRVKPEAYDGCQDVVMEPSLRSLWVLMGGQASVMVFSSSLMLLFLTFVLSDWSALK
jgi:hypothetical protein